MANILAIDTSSAWCSVALSLEGRELVLRHEPVSSGASQLLLPWIEEMLDNASISLNDLGAIAVGIGPGAFTGVRLGVAAVQGLAISNALPVIPVCSLDAIAAQLVSTQEFQKLKPKHFVIAIDARMEEVYWAKYDTQSGQLPVRVGDIRLTSPEQINLENTDFFAGSAIDAYRDRLPGFSGPMDGQITVSALGVLEYAEHLFAKGLQQDVRALEPLYVRNKVALTTAERQEAFK